MNVRGRRGAGSGPIAARTALGIAALLLAFAPMARADSEPAKGAPQLGGIWKLNEKQSDNWADKMGVSRGPGGGGGERGGGGRGEGGGFGGGGGRRGGGGEGGWGGRGGGGGWGGRRGGGGPDGGPPGGGPEAAGSGVPRDSTRAREMQWLQQPPTTLLIEQTDSTVVLSENTVTLQVLAMAAPDTSRSAQAPGPQRFAARWHGARLEAERTGFGGRKRTETFELAKDGKSLVIVTKLDGGNDRPSIELKRVYDKYQGD
jgi:hypothetical protein